MSNNMTAFNISKARSVRDMPFSRSIFESMTKETDISTFAWSTALNIARRSVRSFMAMFILAIRCRKNFSGVVGAADRRSTGLKELAYAYYIHQSSSYLNRAETCIL